MPSRSARGQAVNEQGSKDKRPSGNTLLPTSSDALMPNIVNELERLRLEQAKTNELLQQILLPLTFISGCCSALLAHVQRLAASCCTALTLLEDCSRTLHAIRLHTAKIAATFSKAAKSATNQALLDEHAVHAGRAMNIAAATCLLVAVTINLKYRWLECRHLLAAPPPPLQRLFHPSFFSSTNLAWPLWGRGQARSQSSVVTVAATVASTDLMAAITSVISRAWRSGSSVTTNTAATEAASRRFSKSSGPSIWRIATANLGREWGVGSRKVADTAMGPTSTHSVSLGGCNGLRCSSSNIRHDVGSGPPTWSTWWWWYWCVGSREVSVLSCRTRLAGGILVGSLILLLWSALRLYWGAVRQRQATPPAPVAERGNSGGCGDLFEAILSQPPLSQQEERQSRIAAVGPEIVDDHTSVINGVQSDNTAMYGTYQTRLKVLSSRALVTYMWRRSGGLIVVHTPAWVAALAVMGGSSLAWLALQLTWHAMLPYAVGTWLSDGDGDGDGDGGDPAASVTIRVPESSDDEASDHGSRGGVVLAGGCRDGRDGAAPHTSAAVQLTSRSRPAMQPFVAAAVAAEALVVTHGRSRTSTAVAAAGSAGDGAVAEVAHGPPHATQHQRQGPHGYCPTTAASVPTVGSKAIHAKHDRGRVLSFFSLLGFRSRHKSKSKKPCSGSRAASGTIPTPYLRSHQLQVLAVAPPQALESSQAPPPPPPPSTRGGGDPLNAQTSSICSAPEATKRKASATRKLELSDVASWVTAATVAGVRYWQPVLAALWLYAGPLLLGALPMLPAGWLWGRLADIAAAVAMLLALSFVVVGAVCGISVA